MSWCESEVNAAIDKAIARKKSKLEQEIRVAFDETLNEVFGGYSPILSAVHSYEIDSWSWIGFGQDLSVYDVGIRQAERRMRQVECEMLEFMELEERDAEARNIIKYLWKKISDEFNLFEKLFINNNENECKLICQIKEQRVAYLHNSCEIIGYSFDTSTFTEQYGCILDKMLTQYLEYLDETPEAVEESDSSRFMDSLERACKEYVKWIEALGSSIKILLNEICSERNLYLDHENTNNRLLYMLGDELQYKILRDAFEMLDIQSLFGISTRESYLDWVKGKREFDFSCV